MPTYMDIHSGMKGLTREQLEAEHRKDLENQGPHGVRFIKAWGDPDSGKVFCLSEGPNKDTVKKVHEIAGHAADEIYELPLTVE